MGGMVSIADFKAHPAPRDLQFEGVFRPTMAGLEVARALRDTFTGARLYRFLLDMCLASAATTDPHRRPGDLETLLTIRGEEDALDQILAADLTYRRAIRRTGDMLELRDAPDEETPTVTGLSTIEQCLEQQGAYNRKDVVAAYQALLMRRSAQAA
jgi:hypothetical protein